MSQNIGVAESRWSFRFPVFVPINRGMYGLQHLPLLG